MRRVTFVTLVALLGGLVGCKREKATPPPAPPPRVTVVSPATVPVRDYWTYNGHLETTKGVEVRSKIRGFITSVAFEEGSEVERGKLLYTIDRLEYETALKRVAAEAAKAEAEIKNWEAQILQAKSDLARVTEAVQRGAESKTEQDKAQAAYDVRVASRDAAMAARDAALAARKTAEIQVSYTDIKATIGGRISRTLVHEGNLIQADTTLLTTIVAVDWLYVYFDAPEADLIAYQRSLIALSPQGSGSQSVPVEVGVTREEGYPHVGTIDFRENRVEAATGTIRIRGRLENPLINGHRLLFPGMYARVRVPKGDPVPQFAVPEDCLLSGQEGRFLYVVGADNKVEKRLVTVGTVVWKAPPTEPGVAPPSWVAVNPNPPKPVEGQPPAPTRRTIKSVVAIPAGLNPGDRVILDGIQKTKPGDAVQAEEWDLKPPAAVAKSK
jgi:RND family efflux transporter MFP subunit